MADRVEIDSQPTKLPFACRNIIECLAREGVGCDWHVQLSMGIRTTTVRGTIPCFSCPFWSVESSLGGVESSGWRSGSVGMVVWMKVGEKR